MELSSNCKCWSSDMSCLVPRPNLNKNVFVLQFRSEILCSK
jgi:hypothetical protein